MNTLEQNIIKSFRRAKEDIIQLQTRIITLKQNQSKIVSKLEVLNQNNQRLLQTLDDIKTKEQNLHKEIHDLNKLITEKLTKKPKTITRTKTVTKKVPARKKPTYVASKTGKKFHIPHCPFAKNIKPKSKVKFKSKTTALNNGYKACDCV